MKTPRVRPTEEELIDTSRQNKYFHREKGIIMDTLGGVCSECQTDEYLEIHHIKGADLSKNRPGAERIRDWKEQLKKDNLLLLCQDCHDDITRKRTPMNMSKREGMIKLG